MKIRYHDQARAEILEATEYYANIRPELGEEFRIELENALNKIASNPLQFAEIHPRIRCYLLDRFPYGVYYRVPDARTVRITVVKHHRRRPGYGMRRK